MVHRPAAGADLLPQLLDGVGIRVGIVAVRKLHPVGSYRGRSEEWGGGIHPVVKTHRANSFSVICTPVRNRASKGTLSVRAMISTGRIPVPGAQSFTTLSCSSSGSSM